MSGARQELGPESSLSDANVGWDVTPRSKPKFQMLRAVSSETHIITHDRWGVGCQESGPDRQGGFQQELGPNRQGGLLLINVVASCNCFVCPKLIVIVIVVRR